MSGHLSRHEKNKKYCPQFLSEFVLSGQWYFVHKRGWTHFFCPDKSNIVRFFLVFTVFFSVLSGQIYQHFLSEHFFNVNTLDLSPTKVRQSQNENSHSYSNLILHLNLLEFCHFKPGAKSKNFSSTNRVSFPCYNLPTRFNSSLSY